MLYYELAKFVDVQFFLRLKWLKNDLYYYL